MYWSTISERDRQTSPRTGFFYNFDRSEVLAKRFNSSTEGFEDVSPDDTARIKAGLKDIDSGLAAEHSFLFVGYLKKIDLP